MKKVIGRRWLWLVIPLLPSIAGAAGLGKLTVLSSLGQPLHAEVELVSVQQEELSTLSARLVPAATYQQANRQYGPVAASLRFQIEKRADGQPVIKMTSEQAVYEPFLDLLLELNGSSGRLVREYTALIDPPNYAQATPSRMVTTQPAAPEKPIVPVAQASSIAATPATSTWSQYGPVKRGESLSRIAAKVKPEGVSLEQMLVSIFRNNPDAFIGNNMNRLKADKILRIPAKETLTALLPAEAIREVRGQLVELNRYRRKTASSLHVQEKTSEGKPILRLSSGDPSGGRSSKSMTLEEEIALHQRVLSDTNPSNKPAKSTTPSSSTGTVKRTP